MVNDFTASHTSIFTTNSKNGNVLVAYWKNPPEKDEAIITQTHWNHADKVHKLVDCSNLGQYHQLNLKSEARPLASVIEEFIKIWCDTYAMDSVQHLTCLHLYKKYSSG